MDVGPLSSIAPLSRLTPLTSSAPVQGAAEGSSFQAVFGQVLGAHAGANAQADKAIQALATGQTDDLHTVGLAVTQADLTFRMILEMRNRLTDAYQEVMRMQV